MAFWCAILKAGESKAVEVMEMDVILTLGNVALNNGAEGKHAKLWATVEDEDGPQKVLLATLRSPHAEQAVLDITFPQDVTLSVEGAGEVHISGIIAPAEDEDEDDAAFGGFGSDEELGSDEEGGMGGAGGSDEDEEMDSLDSDPRVQELGSDGDSEEPITGKPAAGAAKLLTRKPEAPAQAGAAKKQRVEVPITAGGNKKPAAAAAAGGKPAPGDKAKAKAAPKPAAAGGVASLKCSVCNKDFNAPAGLEQHMKAKHGGGADGKPAEAKPAAAAAATPAKPATPKGGKPAAGGAGTPKAAAGTPKAAAGTPKSAKK